jgi:hypothetical protein
MVMPRSRSMSIESRTCSFISRSVRPPHLDQPVGERRLAMVDMGDDGEVADMVFEAISHLQIGCLRVQGCAISWEFDLTRRLYAISLLERSIDA